MSSLQSEGGALSFADTPQPSSLFLAQGEESSSRLASFATNAKNQPARCDAAKTTETQNIQKRGSKAIKTAAAISAVMIPAALIGGCIALGLKFGGVKSGSCRPLPSSPAPLSIDSTPSAPSPSPMSSAPCSLPAFTEPIENRYYNKMFPVAPSVWGSLMHHPSELELFAHLKANVCDSHWSDRAPDKINLVHQDRFKVLDWLHHSCFSDIPLKLDNATLKRQAAKKEKVAYFFADYMDACDYDEDTDTLNARPKDKKEDDKQSLRALLSPYHIRNPSIVAAGNQGVKAIPIPLLPANSFRHGKNLEKMKKILNLQLPVIYELIENNYTFVVLGQQDRHETTNQGFPLHHGLGISDRVKSEDWFRVVHQFLFEVSYKTNIKTWQDDKKKRASSKRAYLQSHMMK
eukprot:GHVT01091594.1.p1 GENE.GHVT01091594.1~~GHVT01091594.1.p1  ORF type:complete len:404 (+),score=55.59 GHVT01091594.1:457-1668(+)